MHKIKISRRGILRASILILSILLLLAIGIKYHLWGFLQQKNQGAMWEIFEDKELNYSISYPSGWYPYKFSPDTMYGNIELFSDAPGNISYQAGTPGERARFLISRDANPKSLTLEQWVDNSYFANRDKEYFDLNGIPAVRVSFPPDKGSGTEWVMVVRGSWVYNLRGMMLKGIDYPHNQVLVREMQNSFRFTD